MLRLETMLLLKLLSKKVEASELVKGPVKGYWVRAETVTVPAS